MYESIQTETQRTTLRVMATRAEDAKRKLSLYALDRVLWALEEMNLAERTTVPSHVVEQLHAFGVPYNREIKIPDLIELVFTAQEQFMNVARNQGYSRFIRRLDDGRWVCELTPKLEDLPDE